MIQWVLFGKRNRVPQNGRNEIRMNEKKQLAALAHTKSAFVTCEKNVLSL